MLPCWLPCSKIAVTVTQLLGRIAASVQHVALGCLKLSWDHKESAP